MNFRRDRKVGSSLILVLLILAGVTTVVLGTQRVSLIQFKQSSAEEDNVLALYAAKAGIEDMALRERFNRDTEIVPDSDSKTQVQRFDLTAGALPSTTGLFRESDSITTTPGYDPGHQYYDVKVNLKTPWIDGITPNAINAPPPELLTLAKDDYLELTGFPSDYNNGAAYYLRYKFRFVNADGSGDCDDPQDKAFVQIQEITNHNDGSSADLSQVTATRPANSFDVDSSTQAKNILIKDNAGLSSYIRIRPYYCSVKFFFTTSGANNHQGYTASDHTASDPGPTFDSLNRIIFSTGYFGQAKRTLVGTYDPKSGQLVSVADFNLYAGGNISPPP